MHKICPRIPGLVRPSVIKETYSLIKLLQTLYVGWEEVTPPAMVSRHSSETKDSSSSTISHALHSSLPQKGCLNAQTHAKLNISPRPKYCCQRTHEGKMFVPSLLRGREQPRDRNPVIAGLCAKATPLLY